MSQPPSSSSQPAKAEKVRVTADLPLGTIELLRTLAASQDVTLTEALKRAIATEGLLQQRVNEKSKVLLQSEDGKISELIFRK